MRENDGFAELGKFGQKLVEQPASAFIEVQNAFEIQYQVIGSIKPLEDVANNKLAAGKSEVPLELVGSDRRAKLMQGFDFLGCADPARVQLRTRKFQSDHRTSWTGPIEEVQI